MAAKYSYQAERGAQKRARTASTAAKRNLRNARDARITEAQAHLDRVWYR